MHDHQGFERIDLARVPLSYPGPAATEPMLVLPHCRHRVTPIPGRPLGAARVIRCEACTTRDGVRVLALDDELCARGAAPMDQRAPVVAVGSNASPGVVRVKLDRTGGDAVIPMFPARVRHLRIGISAHVSRPGFLPAAPARVQDDLARVVVGWPDREQLPRLDLTEPNYRRISLRSSDFPLALDGLDLNDPEQNGPELERPELKEFELYESRWGVLVDPDGPRRLLPQPELFAVLGALRLEPWRSQPPQDAVRTLAASEDLRAALRDQFRILGMAGESGL